MLINSQHKTEYSQVCYSAELTNHYDGASMTFYFML